MSAPVIDPAALLRLPNLAAALAKVQAKLPKLERDRTVEVQPKDPKKDPYSYSYVTLAHLSDAILPLLAEHGLAFVALPGAGSDGKMAVRYLLLHESGEALSGEFPISGEGGIQMIGGRITYARRYCLAALVGVAADEDDESRLAEDGGPRTAQRAPARARNQRPAPAAEGQPVQRAQRTAPPEKRPAPVDQPPLPGEEQPAGGRFAGGGITDAQQRKLHACLREAGIGTREEGLAYISDVLDKTITSTKELTKADAVRVIDRLEAWLAQQEPPAGGEGQ